MNAHLLVIIAAALTAVVPAALATALATFSGQALPVPPVSIQFGWAQTLALAVAIPPVLAVALTIVRRPDAAALRAAEAVRA
jgi:hypothetical protein